MARAEPLDLLDLGGNDARIGQSETRLATPRCEIGQGEFAPSIHVASGNGIGPQQVWFAVQTYLPPVSPLNVVSHLLLRHVTCALPLNALKPYLEQMQALDRLVKSFQPLATA